MAKNHKIVQNMWKSTFKSSCKSLVKLCAKYKKFIQRVENTFFPHTFPTFSTTFPTTHPPLANTPLFHFFTDPTITTINNI